MKVIRKGVTLRIVARGEAEEAGQSEEAEDWLGSDEELTKSAWLESDEHKAWLEEWKDFK